MAVDRDGIRTVRCIDCGESSRSFSPFGESYFRLRHAGHRLSLDARSEPDGRPPEGGPSSSDAEVKGAGSTPARGRTTADSPSPREGAGADAAGTDASTQTHRAGKGTKAEGRGTGARVKAKDPPEAGGSAGLEAEADGVTPLLTSEGDLLLANPYYVEGTHAAEFEARRVSKVLAEFRWNITPPYTIAMLFSDILCLTSDAGSIRRDLVERIEKEGYAFSGFEANNSRPLAWFKRRSEEEPEPHTRLDPAKLQELSKAVRDQSVEIESEMAKIEREREQVAEALKLLGSHQSSR
jgi:hypothetical protein